MDLPNSSKLNDSMHDKFPIQHPFVPHQEKKLKDGQLALELASALHIFAYLAFRGSLQKKPGRCYLDF